MSLLAVGISHQTAPVALLEQVSMSGDDRVKALHELVESTHVSEAIVLATCNRVEVFAEVDRFHGGVTDVSRVLARHAGATVEELAPYVTVYYEDQAIGHLCTVAAGLDSMVVGETQVLGQLRAAYALAQEEGTVGRELHPIAQRALRVGKRVHAETGIDKAGASLVSVALGYAVGRIGCFLVGDDYGVPTDAPWGVTFPYGLPATTAANLRLEYGSHVPPDLPPDALVPVHPTQLYETAICLGIWALGLIMLRRRVRRGGTALAVGALLAVERFGIEFLRAKDDRFFHGFTVAQVISVLLLVLVLGLWLRWRRTA